MKMKSQRVLFLLLIVAIFVGAPRPASAQDDQDPPGRVARLNYIQGAVSYQVSGDKDWIEADPNRPLTTGDNLWVDKDSRGEVHIGASSIRLSNETGISFLNLDDRTIQIQLAQGTIQIHYRHQVPGDAFEIDTANIAFTLTKRGEYRISTDADGYSTIITVREGEGQVTGGGESYTLESGQQYTVTGTDPLSFDNEAAPAFDDFETWCQSRDDRENNALSAKYVSRDVDGYYDLDDYGDWQPDSTYGVVWYPRGVAAEWVPYHFGHWVWIAPWGWTWVGSEPWGFAPFHYGRWAFVGTRWAWVPGPVVVRPFYAPALVAFVGGGGFGVSVGFGAGFSGVAWFPLGPHDMFIPSYRVTPRYVERINITNTRLIDRTYISKVYNDYTVNHVTDMAYANREAPGAVTAVSRETFVNARPVAKESIHVTSEEIRSARVVDSTPLAPSRTSYVASTARVASAKPTFSFQQKAVVAKLPPRAPAEQGTYTNDSREFSREPVRTNNGAVVPNAENSESGGRQTGSNDQRAATPNRSVGETNPQGRPAVRFSPPDKANDNEYDVHPPSDRNAAPRPEQRPAPPPKTPQHQAPPPPHSPK
jgi:uncharacterized protein DUF6600